MTNNILKTSVYVKPTNLGDLVNFHSICPDKYKLGVIKTLLHRGYQICSDWESFHNEINRIKQLLTNNNFPMQVIDNTVRDFLNKINVNNSPLTTGNNPINLFFQGQMSSNYKMEENELKKMVSDHVKPVNENYIISLKINYTNKKLNMSMSSSNKCRQSAAKKVLLFLHFVSN